MNIISIIPARGGSKGIPKKNLHKVAGHPLIAWTIHQSLQSSRINRTIVSTDSEEIKEVALKYGAEVPFMRPSEFAQDDSPTEPVLLHALSELKRSDEEPDVIVLLQPTSPIRFDGSIDRAIKLFEEGGYDSVLSVHAVHHLYWKNADNPSALYDYKARPRRQDAKEEDQIYAETGSIYVTKTSTLLSEENRLGGKIGVFPMRREESVDVDTEEDFALVDMLASHLEGFSSPE